MKEIGISLRNRSARDDVALQPFHDAAHHGAELLPVVVVDLDAQVRDGAPELARAPVPH